MPRPAPEANQGNFKFDGGATLIETVCQAGVGITRRRIRTT
ncbi:MAG: hypothetical protein QOF66_7234 [Mycobacterium sp.]|nr:hypothetical protein [Mycobacterium sp.]